MGNFIKNGHLSTNKSSKDIINSVQSNQTPTNLIVSLSGVNWPTYTNVTYPMPFFPHKYQQNNAHIIVADQYKGWVVQFANTEFDPLGCYSNGLITIPQDGDYKISFTSGTQANFGSDSCAASAMIKRNGNTISSGASWSNNGYYGFTMNYCGNLLAYETISIHMVQLVEASPQGVRGNLTQRPYGAFGGNIDHKCWFLTIYKL